MSNRPTGFDAERATLAAAFIAAFKGEDGNAPFTVIHENQTAPNTKGAAWGRFSVRPGTVAAAEIGTEMRRNPGVLYLQMFLPANSGTKLANEAAEVLSDAFDFASFDLPSGVGSIKCECVSVTNVGLDAASGLMQVNASVEYTREVFVSPMTYLQLCCSAAWSFPARTLHAGTPTALSTDVERYAAAIWGHAPRTLTV